MCEVSDKLKLCTCVSNIDELKHYWVLYRFNEEKIFAIVGEVLSIQFISDNINRVNKKTLLHLINDTAVFDNNIQPKLKDRLLISFGIGDSELHRLNYGFEFKGNKWREIKYNPLDWQSHHDEEEYGEIKNAFNRDED